MSRWPFILYYAENIDIDMKAAEQFANMAFIFGLKRPKVFSRWCILQ